MKNPVKLFLFSIMLFTLLPSCKKIVETVMDHGVNAPKPGQFYKYTILQGQHYADNNALQSVQYDELKFAVRFDSTAIYQALDSENQEDINKLYGFSDNNAEHQQFSARFGWNWTRGALRLYAYVYNNGERSSEEISAIQIGTDYTCSIKNSASQYIFSVDNISVEMLRASSTAKAAGYKLYPYFGGDETAPHTIHIWIKEF